MVEQKILYNRRFAKNPLTSKTEHDGELYEVTIMGYDTNNDDEGSIVYSQFQKWIIQKVMGMCGFIEVTDSLIDD